VPLKDRSPAPDAPRRTPGDFLTKLPAPLLPTSFVCATLVLRFPSATTFKQTTTCWPSPWGVLVPHSLALAVINRQPRGVFKRHHAPRPTRAVQPFDAVDNSGRSRFCHEIFTFLSTAVRCIGRWVEWHLDCVNSLIDNGLHNVLRLRRPEAKTRVKNAAWLFTGDPCRH
jgi:hypothetical protein